MQGRILDTKPAIRPCNSFEVHAMQSETPNPKRVVRHNVKEVLSHFEEEKDRPSSACQLPNQIHYYAR